MDSVIQLVAKVTEGRPEKPAVVIKSTVPVGYTRQTGSRFPEEKIHFSPEFLRES